MARATNAAVGDDQTEEAPVAGVGDEPHPSPQGDDGEAMEIHKPKPWHGLREFLKEYLIIFVGVLTALGAEQAVEWLHWRSDVAEAREALREEVRTNASIGMLGVEESRCLSYRLEDDVAWAKGGSRPNMARSAVRLMGPASTVWDTYQAGQTIARMPSKERLAYAHYYTDVANEQTVIQTVRTVETQLARYADKTALTPDEARRLDEDVAVARVWYRVRSGDEAELIAAAKHLGIEPEPLGAEDRNRLAPLCKPPTKVPRASGHP